MILARLTNAVRQQNWFAVVLEFAIVVFAVLFAFQVSFWAERAGERADELDYLQRLRADLISSLEANWNFYGFMSRQNAAMTMRLDSLDQCALAEEDRDAFATALFLNGKNRFALFDRRTLDEMNAAGAFGHIRNPRVRDAIIDMTQQIDAQQGVGLAMMQRAIPHTNYIESRIRYQMPDLVAPDGALPRMPFGARPIRWEEIEVDFPALCADAAFIRALSVTQAYSNDVRDQNVRLMHMQAYVITVIGEELDARGQRVETHGPPWVRQPDTPFPRLPGLVSP
jgi:hypothetical protein